VSRPETREEVRRGADLDVDVAPRRDEDAVVAQDERAVELGEFLDSLAELGPVDLQELGRVSIEGVEQQRTRLRQHVLDITDDEERADLASLAALAG
jgi:hypothetical protein